MIEIKPKAAPLYDTTRAEILAVAEQATTIEKQHVAELIEWAKAGKSTRIEKLTPAVCAILFLYYNGHNRDWKVETCQEYARRMRQDAWRFNNASIGFYNDGMVEDGQHRLSGAAVAYFNLETSVVFGIDRDAIVTVDDGQKRGADGHGKLYGIVDAKVKEQIVRTRATYLTKMGDRSAALRSQAETYRAMSENDDLLNLAIDIGNTSAKNIADPVLKPITAYRFAYLLLKADWPEQHIREDLALFQTGISTDSEKTPYFVAASVIASSRNSHDRGRDRLPGVKELGVAVYVFVQTAKGAKAIAQNSLRNAVKKTLPDPAYPGVGNSLAEAAD